MALERRRPRGYSSWPAIASAEKAAMLWIEKLHGASRALRFVMLRRDRADLPA